MRISVDGDVTLARHVRTFALTVRVSAALGVLVTVIVAVMRWAGNAETQRSANRMRDLNCICLELPFVVNAQYRFVVAVWRN